MDDRRVLLGLIGSPIAHSAAPAMHEAAGRATGMRVHYQLIDVPGADAATLRLLLEGVRRLGFAGVNVTFPYKEAVLPLLDAIAPEAAPIGAVNTVVARDGRLTGHNTDTTGFAAAITGEIAAPAAGPVALIGAGGVGRAAGFALARLGVPELRILDREPEKAAGLARDLGGMGNAHAATDLAEALRGAVGVVNATPVGMLPDRGTPVPPALLHAGLWVADVVYYPLITPLLEAARAAGARTVTGTGADDPPGRRCVRAVHRGPPAGRGIGGRVRCGDRRPRPGVVSPARRPQGRAPSPSPLAGEGWGGGCERHGASCGAHPPPRPSPARGEGEAAWRAVWVRLVVVLLALGAAPALGCTVARQAVVPITLQAGHPLVAARLDGRAATFILDTGAQRSLLTPEAVRRLDLKLDPWVGTTVVGIGGIERHRNAEVASLVLSGVALRQNTLLRGLSLSVGAIPAGEMGRVPVDGILGRDVLSAFDLSLDVGQRRITLYRVRGCSGRFLPWRRPYVAVPALPGYRALLAIPVRADGRELRAMIDTGSTGGLLTGAGMARLGLTAAALAHRPQARAQGIGPRSLRVRVYRLGWLAVGGAIARDVKVVAAPVILTPILDLLLGIDWLATHRVWLSYATGQVFVAR